MSENLNKLFRAMETSGKPFVAAINGHALGGGLEICLACHYRVATDNDRIQIGQPEAKIKDIKNVYSHAQALSQCSKFIKKKKH